MKIYAVRGNLIISAEVREVRGKYIIDDGIFSIAFNFRTIFEKYECSFSPQQAIQKELKSVRAQYDNYDKTLNNISKRLGELNVLAVEYAN